MTENSSLPFIVSNRASWMKGTWGLMFHYLDKVFSSDYSTVTSSEDWNRRIDQFDLPRFASQVRATGAQFIIFTLGQNTGHFCSPNEVYDELTGVSPSLLSRRDLMAEIAEALSPYLKVIVYFPASAPAYQPEVIRALRFTPPWDATESSIKEVCWPKELIADSRLTEFQRNWEKIITCWGNRWGEKVAGWWLDGCYYAEKMYDGDVEPNLCSFARALRAGNENRVLAFNPGTKGPFTSLGPDQDYSAGEVSNLFPVPSKVETLTDTMNGIQTHIMSYLGDWWGEGEPRFPDAFVKGYTQLIVSIGGSVSWDVPILPSGEIPENFLKQIKSALGKF